MANLTNLMGVGLDAFTNLYDVVFTIPDEITTTVKLSGDTITNLSVRVQDFPFPNLSVQPYPIYYKGIVIRRFPPKIQGERKLTLRFRLDNDWLIYDGLLAWKKLYYTDDTGIYNFDKMGRTTNDSKFYGAITVQAYKATTSYNIQDSSTETKGPVWKFNQVQCISLDEPQFSRDSANPIEIGATFLFGEYVPATETV